MNSPLLGVGRGPILFLPIIDWELRWQRPQHLARCFARAGHRVYYPSLRLQEAEVPPKLIESGVWRIALRGDPALDPYRDLLTDDAMYAALKSLEDLDDSHPLTGCWFIVQLPFWRSLAEAARETFQGRLLFDCLDDYASFGDHADHGADECALAKSADLVTVTASVLYKRHAHHSRRCMLLRNGCDPEHFGPALARRPGSRRPVIGFFGGIHDWFDVELVERLATTRRDWDFWLVGDTYRANVAPLRALENVLFFGELPYDDLPRIASFFDVGFIPFRDTPLTRATNPIKVYEMLASGLPVVATELPELQELGSLVATASQPFDFVRRIAEALAEPSSAREGRRRRVLRESWVERFFTLRAAMDEIEQATDEVERNAEPRIGRYADASTISDLGLGARESRWPTLHSRVAELETTLRHRLSERLTLVERVAGLDEERLSLVEQRDRVAAELARVRSELARAHGSLWNRLGARLGLL